MLQLVNPTLRYNVAVHERHKTKLFSSSGGNAGIAVSFAARRLAVSCTVVVPESTPEQAIKKMKEEGSEVIVHGKMWSEAHEKALELAQSPDSELIHPFDHEEIWDGHISIIRECVEQLLGPPDAIITVAGGGGLLVGIVRGLKAVGWDHVPVYVSETEGADSLSATVKAGRLVRLPAITSIAKTLGAAQVATEAFNVTKQHPVISCVVSDKSAVHSILSFQSDHQILVEPSCAAGLALLYDKASYERYFSTFDGKTILVIVCGGSGINLDMIAKWKSEFEL